MWDAQICMPGDHRYVSGSHTYVSRTHACVWDTHEGVSPEDAIHWAQGIRFIFASCLNANGGRVSASAMIRRVKLFQDWKTKSNNKTNFANTVWTATQKAVALNPKDQEGMQSLGPHFK